ncbi:hypothetical protein CONLIGDRAFT_719385 [Coniochaeta ligniaria NRRL 30616]|uniref:Uncharacterized protein n=1 Tax=Coniochaeta ligniaria NRRL 30616 TaxID=1408157 RepID=A0A1J7I6T6_9PEZI|nr:hypothetical protein CONLIGDRAFT_719385 [Coniochaeta ligniaria NRRL 30616]
MASSTPTAGTAHPQVPENPVKQAEFDILEKAMIQAMESCLASYKLSTTCVLTIESFESGMFLRALAAGGPHAHAFDDPLDIIEMGADLWVSSDAKFIEQLKSAQSLLFTSTQQKTDCLAFDVLGVYKDYYIPILQRNVGNQLKHVETLEDFCRVGRGLTQTDLEFLGRHAAQLRVNYDVIKGLEALNHG